MTNKPDEELDIETSSRKRLIEMHTREEKRDVYMMVAKASVERPGCVDVGQISLTAEFIYEGLIKFCGEIK